MRQSGTSDTVGTIVAVMALSAASTATLAQPVKRELHIRVETNAEQSWESVTEEFGRQHTQGSTHQMYELKLRLRSNGIRYKRNILNPNRDKRLKAKTIHLARQAKAAIEASGESISIPSNKEEKQALARRKQEEIATCKRDIECRQRVQMRYAKLFAAAQYPEIMKQEPGGGRYLYFEPYEGCPVRTRVAMELTIEGIHYSERADELVSYKETRSADTINAPTDVPLCERYLAVIDTKADRDPFYLENFYIPNATGETVIREDGSIRRRETEEQPQLTQVLGWVTQKLRRAPLSGSAKGTIRLSRPINARSRQIGDYSDGRARVELKWHFKPIAAKSGMP